VNFFLNRSIWQSYKQERGWRGCLTHFAHLANTMLKDEESARDNHVKFVILPVICRFKKITDRVSNKPLVSWLLTTPPHLTYLATLPYNLSLMACFANTNVSQGSVATYAKCGGIFNIHLTTHLSRNLPVNFFNRLRFDRIIVMSLWPHFLAHQPTNR